MKKLAIAAAALVALAPAAAAEKTTPVTVEIAYDEAMLASDSGAEAVLASMRQQARSACTSSGRKYGRGPMVDRACAADVMSKAAVQILHEREELGLETAPAFARVASLQTAGLEQR